MAASVCDGCGRAKPSKQAAGWRSRRLAFWGVYLWETSCPACFGAYGWPPVYRYPAGRLYPSSAPDSGPRVYRCSGVPS